MHAILSWYLLWHYSAVILSLNYDFEVHCVFLKHFDIHAALKQIPGEP